jgi:hypothetical protein
VPNQVALNRTPASAVPVVVSAVRPVDRSTTVSVQVTPRLGVAPMLICAPLSMTVADAPTFSSFGVVARGFHQLDLRPNAGVLTTALPVVHSRRTAVIRPPSGPLPVLPVTTRLRSTPPVPGHDC